MKRLRFIKRMRLPAIRGFLRAMPRDAHRISRYSSIRSASVSPSTLARRDRKPVSATLSRSSSGASGLCERLADNRSAASSIARMASGDEVLRSKRFSCRSQSASTVDLIPEAGIVPSRPLSTDERATSAVKTAITKAVALSQRQDTDVLLTRYLHFNYSNTTLSTEQCEIPTTSVPIRTLFNGAILSVERVAESTGFGYICP